MERIDVAGLSVCNFTMQEAVAYVSGLANGDKCGNVVVTPNAEIAKDALDNKEFGELIKKAEVIVADGAGVVLASKILGKPLKEKVAGIELFQNLLPEFAKNKNRVFLFGSKPGVAAEAARIMKEKYGELEICGILDGYTYKNPDDALPTINEAQADVVICCLGAPKQELFMLNNKEKFNCKVLMGLGGSLDVISGNVKRAPEFYVKHNLEWLYRLMKEPKRIGRMMKLPKYILKILAIRMGFGGRK
ncbi:MAG: WecB/TagA/CpsF family glycosyltransferase [Clostridia bacterium]|nr:WecB/TagA/CpsF family glycosyltransferase [Clostridia bacterium]